MIPTIEQEGIMAYELEKKMVIGVSSRALFDLDAEMEIYISAVGLVKFEFTGSTNVKDICKIISTYALG